MIHVSNRELVMTGRTIEETTIFKKNFNIFGKRLIVHLCDELWYNDIPIKGGELGIARASLYLNISKVTHPDLPKPHFVLTILNLRITLDTNTYL